LLCTYAGNRAIDDLTTFDFFIDHNLRTLAVFVFVVLKLSLLLHFLYFKNDIRDFSQIDNSEKVAKIIDVFPFPQPLQMKSGYS